MNSQKSLPKRTALPHRAIARSVWIALLSGVVLIGCNSKSPNSVRLPTDVGQCEKAAEPCVVVKVNGKPKYDRRICEMEVGESGWAVPWAFDPVEKTLRPSLRRLRDAGIMLTDKCCDELKKKPMREVDERLGIAGHITGSRAAESEARKMAYLQRGALYYSMRNRQWICNPIVHWSRADVEELLATHDVEIAQIPTTSGRSGCVNCGFGCHIDDRKGRENSLQVLKRRNPTMHEKTMDDWGFRDACRVAGIKTEPEKTLF